MKWRRNKKLTVLNIWILETPATCLSRNRVPGVSGAVRAPRDADRQGSNFTEAGNVRQRQQFVWGCNCVKDAGDLILIPTPGGTIISPFYRLVS